MTRPRLSLFDAVTRAWGGLSQEAREALDLRFRLAKLESRVAANQVWALAVRLFLAGVLLLTALPVLLVLAAELLSNWQGSRAQWLGALSAASALVGVLIGYVGWRTFRRDFAGWEQTAEELREDLVWIEELLARQQERDAPTSNS